MNNNFQNKVINATKWASITEVAAKLVTPVTNMVLARIIAPEAFGVVATITMIISFAEMFTDSGFQKYLIQHEFKDEEEKYNSSNVAFWVNFILAILFWMIIVIFRDQLASLVGNPGLGNVIVVACFQLPLTSFSSIQIAHYRRDFEFKTLFWVRMTSVFIPVVVTIPLAISGLSYWALIVGSLTVQLANAIILTVKSKWKPKLYFSIDILKEMISFSIWSLIEAMSIWLTSWLDTFIIGSLLSEYYLGIYKTSISMVNALMAVITSSILPVLFSTLSRLQDNEMQFQNVFFKFQRLISIIVLPMGVGVFLYSDFATKILLGSQWNEASGVIGIWSLTSSIAIVFGYLNSEVYRAKGRPKLSFFSQVLHLIFLVPVCIISAKQGFWPLVYARSLVRFQGTLVGFIIMKYAMGISAVKMIKNVMPVVFSTMLMSILGYTLQQIKDGILWSIISIILCVIFYFTVLLSFKNMRKEIYTIVKKVKRT